LITTIGQQVAMAIENARLYQQTQRAARELALLHEMSAGLTSTFDTHKIYNQIAEQSARLLDCQLACILNWDKNRQEINCVTAYALDAADADLFRQHAGQVSPAGELLASQQTVAIDDARADPRLPSLWRENLAIRAALCVPIWSADQLLGALFLFDRRLPRRWRTEEIELVESFVNRAVVALMNASLHQQLEWAAALEERQRIAADMHDGLAQTISLLGLQVDEVGEFVRLGLDQQAEEELAYMRVVVERAALDVRKSISNLQGASQTHRSLQELLSEMPAQLPVGDGPQIQLSLPAGEPIFLPQDQSRQLVLIVQEALLNAHRHSQAQTIRLAMHTVDSQLRITVADDGVGFDPRLPAADRPGHFGLGILRARAARLAADLQIDSAQGGGTTVTLILPLSAASNPSQPNLTQLGAARSHGIASEIEA
jgi:signal transduction histidine kinase